MIGCFVAYRVDTAIWCIVIIGVLSLSAWYISLHQPDDPSQLDVNGLVALLPPPPTGYSNVGDGRRAVSNESGGRARARTLSVESPSEIWWPSCFSTRPCVKKCWYIFVVVMRCFVFLFMVLTMNGIWQTAAGSVKYPPRGQMATITHKDGQSQQIHYWYDKQ